MKQESPKEMMLEMPDAIPNVTVWMKTVSFAERPDNLEDFFCYDQNWILSYKKYPEEKITVKPAKGSRKDREP